LATFLFAEFPASLAHKMDTPVSASYDPFFVTASIAVAALASYTALVLADRIKAAHGRSRAVWIAAAATALGGGVWSMHFLGMLAHTVSVPTAYSLLPTGLSLAVAILACALGFAVACCEPVPTGRFVAAGVLAGIGIVSMHYVGMAAIVTPATIRWNPALIVLSVVIAIGAATGAFWFATRHDAGAAKLGAAALMAAAISGMHYTGMAAAHFHRPPLAPADIPIALDPVLLGIIVAVAAMLFLFAVLASAVADRDGTGYTDKRDALTFRGALLLVMGFVVLFVSGGWGMLTWTDYQDTLQRAETTVANAVQIVAETALRVVGERDLALRMIKQRLEAEGMERLRSPDYRESLLSQARTVDALGAVAVLDANGRVLLNTGQAPLGFDASNRAYYRMHQAQRIGDLAVTELQSGALAERPYFAISRRVESRDGGLLGVVVAAIYSEEFRKSFAAVDLGPNASLLLFRQDAKILVRVPPFPPGTSLDVSYSSLFQTRLPQAPTGTYHAVRPVDAKQVITSYQRLEGTPFVTAVTITHEAVLEGWRQRLQRNIAFAIAALVISAALIVVAFRTIRREEKAQAALHALNLSLEERVRDRTAELESAVADRDILLREVHHRVKNNMQVLQSMVHMTERRVPADSRSVFQELSRRIWAMGQIHNQVYATGEPSKLSLRTYLGHLCEYLTQSFARPEIRLNCSLANAEVDLDAAIPLGLIAVECIQNAYKHAFPDGRPGEIALELEQIGARALLTIRDNGVGTPKPLVRTSTGLMLVEALVAQIDGTFAIEQNGGTTIKITFPKREKPREVARPQPSQSA
jgi:NO-binding membrane sensor protein with MHYT domain/two-component sensor histidine kinase